jgi:hypothetical protein
MMSDSSCKVNRLHMTYEEGWLAACTFLSVRFIIRYLWRKMLVIIIIIIITIIQWCSHQCWLSYKKSSLCRHFGSSGMWRFVVGWLVPSVLKGSGSYIFMSRILLGLLALEDGGTTIFQNVRSHSPNDTVSLPRKVEFSALLLCQPKTLSCQFFCFLPQGLLWYPCLFIPCPEMYIFPVLISVRPWSPSINTWRIKGYHMKHSLSFLNVCKESFLIFSVIN